MFNWTTDTVYHYVVLYLCSIQDLSLEPPPPPPHGNLIYIFSSKYCTSHQLLAIKQVHSMEYRFQTFWKYLNILVGRCLIKRLRFCQWLWKRKAITFWNYFQPTKSSSTLIWSYDGKSRKLYCIVSNKQASSFEIRKNNSRCHNFCRPANGLIMLSNYYLATCWNFCSLNYNSAQLELFFTRLWTNNKYKTER